MVLDSSMLSAHENAVPGNWRNEAHGIDTAREQLFLPIVNDRNTVRHEVKNHSVAEKGQSHDHNQSQGPGERTISSEGRQKSCSNGEDPGFPRSYLIPWCLWNEISWCHGH